MLDQIRRGPGGPPPREPIFNIPPIILGLLTVMVAVHGIRQVIPDEWDNEILLRLAFFPGLLTAWMDPGPVQDALRSLAAEGDAGLRLAQAGRYILTNAGLQPWSLLTYAGLHGDWMHVGLNSLWLLAFGTPVARRLGTARCLGFLAATVVAGALTYYVTHPLDLVPVIGASAAVSGCMGGSLRFMFRAETPMAALFGLAPSGVAGSDPAPLQPLRLMLRNRRAMAFIVAWFFANLLFGVGAVSLGSDMPVAWQAHIGGFVFGLLGLPLFDRRPPARAHDEGSWSDDGTMEDGTDLPR